jgi:hypothetical protein
MSDRDFLIWLHERLHYVHGESELVDYMRTLRRIIASTPPDKRSISFGHNSLEDLQKNL